MASFFITHGETPVSLVATLVNVDGDVNPTLNVSNVILNINGKGRRYLQTPATITNITTSQVSYTFTEPDLKILPKGTYNIEFVVTYLDNTIHIYPNDGEQVNLVVS